MSNPFGRSVGSSMVAGPASQPTIAGPSSSASVVDFSSARNDISDAMAGRVTLAMIDLIVLALIGFYLYTKSAQGGS